jgi:hypothetical protein
MTGSAKQSIEQKERMDCFVAPLLAMTANANTPSHSRGAVRPRCAINLRPENRGRGECRAPDAPAASCAHIGSKYAHEYSQRAIGKHPTFPHAMVYGLYRALPGDRLVDTVVCGVTSAHLTPASRRQDHTSSPSASGALVSCTIRVHRIQPRVRDDRDTPLHGVDGEGCRLIWVRRQG